MKSDADTIRSFLLGLLNHFSRTVSSPSGKVDESNETSSQATSSSEPSESSRHHREGQPTPSVHESSASAFSTESSTELPPLSELGELPAVQDHFQAVLKRRLEREISQKPPMFPWESALREYPIDLSETAPQPWLAQLRSLQLPTEIPEDLLTSLLNRCQELIRESLQPGIQLVKAVEHLFPDQPQAMDQIAGLVLANATVRSTATQDLETLKAAFPEGYEGANPQQQVTLTMLAAKDILAALTLTLTPAQPTATREWLTTEGTVTLSAYYAAGTPSEITVEVEVPQASQLSLPTVGQTVTQNRPGTLTLTLPDPQMGRVYPLEIHFSDREANPLTFAIRWIEDQ